VLLCTAILEIYCVPLLLLVRVLLTYISPSRFISWGVTLSLSWYQPRWLCPECFTAGETLQRHDSFMLHLVKPDPPPKNCLATLMKAGQRGVICSLKGVWGTKKKQFLHTFFRSMFKNTWQSSEPNTKHKKNTRRETQCFDSLESLFSVACCWWRGVWIATVC
jgi:hypothetical protein